jgi:hypothetical protein
MSDGPAARGWSADVGNFSTDARRLLVQPFGEVTISKGRGATGRRYRMNAAECLLAAKTYQPPFRGLKRKSHEHLRLLPRPHRLLDAYH